MAQTQHTPGPWEFGKDRRWLFRDDLKADGNFSSTTVLLIHDDAFRPREADARLIEAAPDMLAALKGILTANVDGKNIERYLDAIDAARAAIAKAEGSTNA